MNRSALGAGLIIAASCTPLGSSGGGIEPAGDSPGRGDRVLITAFTDVSAVSAGRRIVYAATTNGVIQLDRQFQRWLPPLTQGVGIGLQPVTAMAVDPLDDAVWYASAGRLVRYEPTIDLLTSMMVPGIVDVIMFDARDPGAGAFVRAGSQWYSASRFGMTTPIGPGSLPPPGARVLPSTLAELYREFPSLQSFGALLTRDGRLESWRVTSGSKATDANEVWLGTYGNGLYRVDPVFNTSEHFPFGLLTPGAGALAAAEGGLWVASGGRNFTGRGGLTFASSDLQRWRWLEGPASRPLAAMSAYDLSVQGTTVWMATDRGLARIDTEREEDLRVWSATQGLPDDRVLSVAARADGAWVGTARGLTFLANETAQARGGAPGETLLRGIAVRALEVVGSTLWIATDAGLMTLDSRTPSTAPQRVSTTPTAPSLARPIRALAHADSVIVAVLDDAIVALDTTSRAPIGRLAAVNLSAVGRVAAVDVDAHSILLAGSSGALLVDRATAAAQHLSVPRDLPAEVVDVLLDPEWAWIATPVGLVRLRRLGGSAVR